MIIKAMTAHFGALDGKTLLLAPGLNVLQAPNESGKSTWCAFLRAMLFGVDMSQRARQGQHPDKVKYRPWSGAPMSGSMELTTGDGRAVTLRRWTERAAQPMQAFSAAVTGTDTPVPGITADNAGQVLTGVDREVFERSAFISRSGLGLKNAPELEKRLIALVCSGDEEQSYQQADQRLRAWLRRRRGTGRRGAIPETEADIIRAEQELKDMAAAAEEADRVREEIAAAEARQAETVKWMEQARSEARKKALADFRAAKDETERCAAALAGAREEWTISAQALEASVFGAAGPEEAAAMTEDALERLESIETLMSALPRPWLPLIFSGIGAVLWAIAAFFSSAAAVAGGAVCLTLTALMWFWRKKIREKYGALAAERDYILRQFDAGDAEDIRNRAAAHAALWDRAQAAARAQSAAGKALEAAKARQKAAEDLVLNGLDFENGAGEAARATRAVKQGQAALERLRERRAQAEGHAASLGDPMALRSGLETSRQRRAELLTQEEALRLALESLEEADRTLQERFSPLLAARAAEYFTCLTGGRYDEITLAHDLTAKTRLTGDAAGWDMDYLSDGARDQLYLAMRLALCGMVLPEEQGCPLILDDALITFDRPRMERALRLIQAMAEKRQVLLFTCHHREWDCLAGDPAVHLIRLGEDERP